MEINQDRIDALLKTVSEHDQVRLTTLYNATVSTHKAYDQDSTATRLRDWQAAEKALAEAVEAIDGQPGTGREDGDKIIGTVADVSRYLHENGYCAPGRDDPVKHSKVYGDVRKGLLPISKPKSITLAEVERYITRAMLVKRSGAGSRKDEIEDLSALRVRRELEKLNIDIRIKELGFKKEMDLLLPKKEVYLHTAMKIAALEAGFKHAVRTSSTDWIAAVGGDLKKTQMLCDLVYPVIDDLLDQFGRMGEIKVVVKRSS